MTVSSALTIETPRAFEPLLVPSRYKGAFGGRGSGKSHFFGERLVELSAFDSIRAVCIREVQKSLAQSVKLLLEDKIKAMGLGGYFRVTDTYIEGRKSNSLIVFQGMQNHTSDSIKSLEGYDLGWVEEAQSLSARSLNLLRPTIRKDAKAYKPEHPLKGSELWFSWNPRFQNDPVETLLRPADGKVPPNSIVVEANWSENPFFPEVLRDEMEYDKRRDPDKYAHVWMGGFEKKSEARVFQNWTIDEFDAPKGVVFYLGVDWGYAVDPSVMVRCFFVGRKLFIDFEAYKVKCPIEQTPALFDQVPGARLWPCRADSSRPETIQYMRAHGFPKMRSSIKGPRSLVEGVEFIKNFDIIVHPRCRHTIDELTLYSYKIDEHTEEILPEFEDKDNHVIDAMRYAVEGKRRSASDIGMPRSV